MNVQENNEYLLERNQAVNENDLLSRLLFLLKKKQEFSDARAEERGMQSIQSDEKTRELLSQIFFEGEKSDEVTRETLRNGISEILLKIDEKDVRALLAEIGKDISEGNASIYDKLSEIAQKDNSDVVKAVEGIAPPIDTRKELTAIQKAVESVGSLVSKIKMPKIPEFRFPDIFNVRGTVSVEKPDWYKKESYDERFSKIEKLLEEIKNKELQLPEYPKFPKIPTLPVENGRVKVSVDRTGGGGIFGSEDKFAKYKIQDTDDGNSTYNYYGYADTSGNYYIMRESSDKKYRYFSGRGNYVEKWSNRSAQTYDYIFNVSIL